MALYERSGAKFYLQLSLGETGHAYLLKGELKSAIPYLQRALSIASEMGNTRMPRSGPAISRLSTANSAIGRMPTSLNQEAIRLKTAANLAYPLLQRLNSARIASGRGDFDRGRTPV